MNSLDRQLTHRGAQNDGGKKFIVFVAGGRNLTSILNMQDLRESQKLSRKITEKHLKMQESDILFFNVRGGYIICMV